MSRIKTVHAVYVAVDYGDNYEYQKKTLCSVSSFNMIETCKIKFSIYTNYPDWWSSRLPWTNHRVYDANSMLNDINAKELKIMAFRTEVSNSLDTQDVVVFFDTELICIYPFLNEVSDRFLKGNYDLALSLECGSTGIHQYTNFNSGLIFARNKESTLKVLDLWLNVYSQSVKLSTLKTKSESVHLPDQLALRTTFDYLHPKILCLPPELNSRFHPVYDYNQHLWSTLHVIHNHSLSDHLSLHLEETNFLSRIFKDIQYINSKANSKSFEWTPKVLNLSDLLESIK